MKICHLADTHLGAGGNHPRRGESGLTLRQEDIIRTFIEAIDRIIAIKPDLCIHAGDIFDAVRPLNTIMATAGQQLHRLAEQHGIPTVIISGNHDAPKQPHVGAPLDVFKQIDNLFVASSGRLEIFRVGEAAVFALPHCLTGQLLQEELARCRPDPEARFNIFAGHGVAAGMPEFAMADLGEQEISIEPLTGFDYVALGHFHNFSQVGPRAWYAGSTERLSQAEREAEKGFIEVDLEPFSLRFHAVAAREMVDVTPIDATGKRGDQLADLIREQVTGLGSSDKIVRLRVEGVTEETLKTLPGEVLTTLKQSSYALDISFQKAKSEEAERSFGRGSIGRLDAAFMEFLESSDTSGFEKERLRGEALRYLADEDEGR